MVAPVPAQISTLRPRLSATARRRPLLTTHYPLCEPSDFLHLRRRMGHVATVSLLFSASSAHFPAPRECASKAFATTNLQAFKHTNSFVCIDLAPLCRLFASFFAFVSFVFNCLQPLFQKHPGWGGRKRNSRLSLCAQCLCGDSHLLHQEVST